MKQAASKKLMLGALGVVFGDIGTSPIYALRQCILDAGSHTPEVVMGCLSLIFWSVTIVVTLKYVWFVTRADNQGEGGIVALTAAVTANTEGRRASVVFLIGMIGAALFYGDSMVTPAVSVLSAVEGLTQVNPGLGRFVLPSAVAILIGLFALQSRGSGAVGRLFGPVMCLWFASLAAVGIYRIAAHPAILMALSPGYAIGMTWHHPGLTFTIMGAAILALTGAEALYADLGHFGRPAISRVWFALVFPCIVLGYFGQGATLLFVPGSAADPFFSALPKWALIPGVGIAMAATVIASQAVISGTFSMTHQAIEFGFLPRLRVVQTSQEEAGQLYVPSVNAFLFVAVLFLLFWFKTSAKLTSAYGIAVGSTMLATTVLMYFAARRIWHWSILRSLSVIVPLFAIEAIYEAANLPKILQGGWFPVISGVVFFTVARVWQQGRRIAADAIRNDQQSIEDFLAEVMRDIEAPGEDTLTRVKGTAVYPGGAPGKVPNAARTNLHHNRVLHSTSIFFANISESAPNADEKQRIEVRDLGNGCFEVVTRHGFMERPNIPELLRSLERQLDEWIYVPERTTFFLPRDEVLARHVSRRLSRWRMTLYDVLARNSTSAAEYYSLPSHNVIELGAQTTLTGSQR